VNLPLLTAEIWTFEDEFSPDSFLNQLKVLLQKGDTIAFGAYAPSQRFLMSTLGQVASIEDAGKVYPTFFDANREEHPHGRSFELAMTEEIQEALLSESTRTDGQSDKPLFFDHFIAYRRGLPMVPLLSFHDAFYGGELWVSGLYPADVIQAFSKGLPSKYQLQRNPDYGPFES
jgi:hypothetical protein